MVLGGFAWFGWSLEGLRVFHGISEKLCRFLRQFSRLITRKQHQIRYCPNITPKSSIKLNEGIHILLNYRRRNQRFDSNIWITWRFERSLPERQMSQRRSVGMFCSLRWFKVGLSSAADNKEARTNISHITPPARTFKT